MLREENKKLLEFVRVAREYLGNVDPTHWVAKRLSEGWPEGRDIEHRVAMLTDNLEYLLQRARAVAQWADATWAGHPAWSDVTLLRVACDSVRDEVPCQAENQCAPVGWGNKKEFPEDLD